MMFARWPLAFASSNRPSLTLPLHPVEICRPRPQNWVKHVMHLENALGPGPSIETPWDRKLHGRSLTCAFTCRSFSFPEFFDKHPESVEVVVLIERKTELVCTSLVEQSFSSHAFKYIRISSPRSLTFQVYIYRKPKFSNPRTISFCLRLFHSSRWKY